MRQCDMDIPLVCITPPVTPLVALSIGGTTFLEFIKAQARLPSVLNGVGDEEDPEDPFTEDDTLLTTYCNAAVERVQELTSLIFLTSTYRMFLPQIPGSFLQMPNVWGSVTLSRGPVTTINSFGYYDTNNAQQTWDPSNYQLEPDVSSWDADLQEVTLNAKFPRVFQTRKTPIWIEFVAGCGTTLAAVPASGQLAVASLCAFWYKNREAFSAKADPPASDPWWQVIETLTKDWPI